MQDFDALWNYSDAAATATKFLDVLENTELSDNHTYIGQLYTQLARTQSLQDRWDEAYAYLDKANALLDKADKVTGVRYLLELGRTELGQTFNSSDDNHKAYELFDAAWNLAREIQADGYAVDAAHMLAIAADEHQATLDWNLKALSYAEQSAQPAAQKWKGSLYNNIGWTYFDNGDHHAALEMFEKALVEREKSQHINNILTAKWCIARVQRELGEIKTALQTQLALLVDHKALNSTDEYVYEELAHCYTAMGDTANAAKYARLAYDVFSKQKWFVQSETERLDALKALM